MRFLALLLLALPLAAQNPATAVFPGAVATDAGLLCWKNGGTTTLNGGIDASTLTVVVTDATNLCAPGVITIDSERMKVCSIATNTLTICSGGRGFDNSSAASHSNGAAVSGFVPAYWLNQMAAEVKAIQGALGADLGSVYDTPTLTTPIIEGYDVGDLPSLNANEIVIVTDGAHSRDCSAGGGSFTVLCRSNGVAAVPLSSTIYYHATDCTSVTSSSAVEGDLCVELDDDTLYSCQPSSGPCNTAGEWIQIAGAGDVTAASAFSNDNRLIRSDGTGKGVQASAVTVDDSGNISTAGSITGGAGSPTTNIATEIAAPGAASSSGEHNYYWDSTSGRLCDHKNGASATHCFAFAFSHATDCSSVTVIDTGIALIAGDTCHEADADTNWIYDGAAWDQIGASGGEVTLLNIEGPLGTTSGGFSTGVLEPGAFTSTVTVASNANISNGAYFIQNATTEIIYFKAMVPAGADLTNFNIRLGLKSDQTTGNSILTPSYYCLAEDDAANVAYTDVSTSLDTALTDLSAANPGTAHQLSYVELLNQNISANCTAGELMIFVLTGSASSAGDLSLIGGRVWTE